MFVVKEKDDVIVRFSGVDELEDVGIILVPGTGIVTKEVEGSVAKDVTVEELGVEELGVEELGVGELGVEEFGVEDDTADDEIVNGAATDESVVDVSAVDVPDVEDSPDTEAAVEDESAEKMAVDKEAVEVSAVDDEFPDDETLEVSAVDEEFPDDEIDNVAVVEISAVDDSTAVEDDGEDVSAGDVVVGKIVTGIMTLLLPPESDRATIAVLADMGVVKISDMMARSRNMFLGRGVGFATEAIAVGLFATANEGGYVEEDERCIFIILLHS